MKMAATRNSLLLLLLLVQAPWSVSQAAAVKASPLVATQAGTLPIILSAPHGGNEMIAGVPERKGEGLPKGPSGFFTGRDVGTEQLAYELAAAIETRLRNKPYYVAARFHRKFIDPNRPPEIAYENAAARPVYDAYHEAVARYCREVQKKFGRGLLLDLHGQGTAKDTVFRGTKDGKSVALLIERFGVRAHNGPKSFFGLLAEHGVQGFPLDGSKERAGFTGGYIVQTYGSHQAFGIDAIQLEFGGDFRAKAQVKDTAANVARAVEDYARLYLVPNPPNAK